MAASIQRQGRSGRPWQRARQRCLAISRVCIWCGHDESQDVDHLIPLSRGGAPLDQANLGPIHGVAGCPTCLRKCNQEKGDKTLDEARVLRTSRDWYAGPGR